MIEQLALATSNAGKKAEFKRLFEPLGVDLLMPSAALLETIEETGETFVENALIKARAVSAATGLPTIADDSGLVVAVLDGQPGVRSARYAGVPSDAQRNNRKLLDALKGQPALARSAHFVCVLVLLQNSEDPLPAIATGYWHGFILNEPRGRGGFGYDPLFYVPSHRCSAAELDTADKNALSHRAQAAQQLCALLRANSLLPPESASNTA